MQNFRHKSGRDGSTFHYYDRLPVNVGEKVEAVKVSLWYTKGKGIVLHIQSMEVEKGEGYTMEKYMLLDSASIYRVVQPMERKSEKKLEAMAAKLDALVPEMAEQFRNKEAITLAVD